MARPTVGHFIKAVREERGHSVTSAAELIGRSRARYYDVEKGNSMPSVDFIRLFFRKMKLSTAEREEMLTRAAREIKAPRLDMSHVSADTREIIFTILAGRKLSKDSVAAIKKQLENKL